MQQSEERMLKTADALARNGDRQERQIEELKQQVCGVWVVMVMECDVCKNPKPKPYQVQQLNHEFREQRSLATLEKMQSMICPYSVGEQ
jgi:hypothetical protein